MDKPFFLCANCGTEVPMASTEPMEGLCERCEEQLQHRPLSLPQEERT